MRDAIHGDGVVPPAVLTWQEEQARFAFQNGQAVFMRNWPYAYSLLQRAESAVAGRFAVAPMPGRTGRRADGCARRIAARDQRAQRQPDAAYALIEFLLQPEQMLERARVAGQFPPRPSLYDDRARSRDALPMPPADARRIIERAVPRPVTPVYSELSEILQVTLHRA